MCGLWRCFKGSGSQTHSNSQRNGQNTHANNSNREISDQHEDFVSILATLEKETAISSRDANRIQEKHRATAERLRTDLVQHYNTELRRQKRTTDAEMADMRDKNRRQLDSFERERARTRLEHEKSVEDLNAGWTQVQQEQTLKHERLVRSLRANIHELNEALLSNDESKYTGSAFVLSSLPQRTDGQIRDQFVQVQQMVEELGRVSWKEDRKVWNEQLVQDFGRRLGPRLAKKAIIQDMIWTVLYRLVFCSPFRMFGDEGLKLESEWFEQCQAGPSSNKDGMYEWPAPSMKAERWRYMTMSECMEILKRPKPSEYDKRACVQRGFKSSVNQLVSELKSTLAEVANVATNETQTIQRLATRASNMWFDFAMHRCRILVRVEAFGLSEHTTAAMKADVAQRDGSLKLMVLPEVCRWGNVRGTELDKLTPIEGCRGEGLELPE